MTRISDSYRYNTALRQIDKIRNYSDKTTEDAATGVRLHKISDDPSSMVRVLRNRDYIGNAKQFHKNLDFARGYLSKTETALTSIHDSLLRAKELAIQQANDTYNADTRMTIAGEVNQIINHVINLGNSSYAGRYVFGGFRTDTPPVTPDGHYLGDDGHIFIQLDEDTFRPINASGQNIFGVKAEDESEGLLRLPDPDNAPLSLIDDEERDHNGLKLKSSKNPDFPCVTVLRDFQTALLNNDKKEIYSSIDRIQKKMDSVLISLTSLGARSHSLEDISERLEKAEEQIAIDNNNLEGTDFIKNALDMKKAESILNYTLESSSKILTPSLLSFLK